MLRLFNTLTKTKEEFKPIEPGKIRFYQCGPTVYWVQHIGNMRAMTLADLFVRALEYVGYEVTLVRNYTDVGHLTSDEDEGEDKMEKGVRREGLSPEEIAQKYIDVFDKDLKDLNHNDFDKKFKPKATEYVGAMIEMVQKLLDNGYAYETPNAVYFDVSKFEGYNKLNRQKLEENKSGAGFGNVGDSNKRNPFDFAIWFFKTGAHKNALQTWESPFNSPDVENGRGFPGWHIECSAMSWKLLGEQLDIHMGGIEHIQVHHTNEIAQSEGAFGKTFVNYWLHNEHLTVDGGKMSKSEGTSYSLADIVDKGFEPIVLRYFFLNSHYRSKQNFTWEALEASAKALTKLTSQIAKLKEEFTLGEPDEAYNESFRQAIEDDFNFPEALALVWKLLKDQNIAGDAKLATILEMDKVLGLGLENVEASGKATKDISPEIQKILDERAEARTNRDFAKSDELRDKLKEEFGLVVKDTAEGQIIE